MYRLFIDEVGHDNLKTVNDPSEQYLCLMGVILHLPSAGKQLEERLNTLKNAVFGTAAVVLHRREIINKKPPPFDALNDLSKRKAFDDGLLEIIEACSYKAIAVHIDKKEHVEKYAVWVHQPYHYCLAVMMERYVMQLRSDGAKGDVMAEWRGIAPNRKLEAAYRYIHKFGTSNMKTAQFQEALSSGELKIQKKDANIAGLQLADLLASPAARYLQCKRTGIPMNAKFGLKVVSILNASKFRSYNGKIEGYGYKLLP